MAKIQYLDKQGLKTFVSLLKNRISKVYDTKGSAIYADEAYVTAAKAGTEGYEASIDSVGVWQNVDGTYTKITEVKTGWVYNITNDFTTDDDFLEGAGHDIVAGINIVAINIGTSSNPTMKWDLLAMGVNLSPYQTKNSETVFIESDLTTSYATADALPATTSDTAETIDRGTIVVLTGDEDGNGKNDIYVADVSSEGAVTWTSVGNTSTIEGAIATLYKIAAIEPLTDTEITDAFNSIED